MNTIKSQRKAVFLLTKITRFISIRIAMFFSKTSIRPNQVTIISFTFGIISSLCFAKGITALNIIGLISFLTGFLLDFVDGDLARLKNRSSIFGEYLDFVTGKFEMVLLFLGVCIGLLRHYPSSTIWPLGFFALSGLFLSHSLLTKNAILQYKHNLKTSPVSTQNKIPIPNIINKRFFRKVLNEILCGEIFIVYALILSVLLNNMLLFLWTFIIIVWFDYFIQVFTNGRKIIELKKSTDI